MKRHLHAILVLCGLLSVTVLSGYSGGPAATNDRGLTGAPSAGGGIEGNCGSCHNGGNYGTPTASITLVNDGDTLNGSSYLPGARYSVTVALSGTGAQPAAHGFQAQILASADNTRAGILSNPGAGTQVTDLSNGRSYAEHTQPSTDSVFTFDWTAPAAMTGEVTLYVMGNLVNRSGGTTGDNGMLTPATLTLAEGVPSSVGRMAQRIPYTLAPNPTTDFSTLSVDLPRNGTYELKVMNALGRIVQERTLTLDGGQQEMRLDLTSLRGGVYIVSLEGAGGRLSTRLLKR